MLNMASPSTGVSRTLFTSEQYGLIKHLDSVFTELIQCFTSNDPNIKVCQEIVEQTFWFVANATTEDPQIMIEIISRTNLIKAMTLAQSSPHCKKSILTVIVWLASNLG